MIAYFITSCLFVIRIGAEKSCSGVFSCPNERFSSDELIEYGANRTMTMRADYLDVFCRYVPELIDCFKDYEDVCTSDTMQNMFQMIRNTYKPICQDYKTEISAFVTPCFNSLSYQRELVNCYDEAAHYKTGPYSTPENCGIDMWATCSYNVLKKCSPANAHVVFPVVEAAKPEICLLK